MVYDIFIYKINDMKKTVRLTESDLMRIVKRVIREESNDINSNSVKITATPDSLLNNNSTEYNKSIGVETLPSCYNYVRGEGMFSRTEVDWIINQMDFPVSNDNPGRLFRYLQGSGIPGAFGGSFQGEPIYKRVIKNSDGLYYPAVEQLRVLYNNDESFETLYSAISSKEFSSGEYNSKGYLILAYKQWIDCVNGVKK